MDPPISVKIKLFMESKSKTTGYVVIIPSSIPGGKDKRIPMSLEEATTYKKYMKKQWDIDIKIVKQ